MKISHRSAALFVAVMALTAAANAIASAVFFEDFQTRIDPDSGQPVPRCSGAGGAGTYLFPENWLLRNVDNRTPIDFGTFISHAWELREEVDGDLNNCAAYSTSHYSPAGSANDWMWTPAIAVPAGGSALRWRARNLDPDFLDGYEVRVMSAPDVPTGGTGAIGNQLTNSTTVFSVAAETFAWSTHTVSLSAYANSSVYIGFRNNTSNRFVLLVDDVRVSDDQPDLAAASVLPYSYATLPVGFSPTLNLAVTARNLGIVTLTNVHGTAQLLRDGAPFGMVVPTTTIASLTYGAEASIATSIPLNLTGNGVWSARFTLVADQGESLADQNNNMLTFPITTIGGAAWSRSEGPPIEGFGFLAGQTADIGVALTLDHTATFEGIRMTTTGGDSGTYIAAHLWAADASGKPTTLIATTPSIVDPIGGVHSQFFVGGPQTLAPGHYVMAGAQMGGNPIRLGMSADRYEPGAGWMDWTSNPTGDWTHPENFDNPYTPMLALVLYDTVFRGGFETLDVSAP